MAFTTLTAFITQGNTQVRYTITATQSGNNLIWTATPNSAKVLCYATTETVYDPSVGHHVKRRYYYTVGSNTLYFHIKVKPKNGSATTSSKKVAIGTVNPRISMSGDGYQAWTPTSEVVSLTATGVYTDYDVYIISSGAGQADQETQILYATTDGGSTPTPPTPPTPTGANGIHVKVGDQWKQAEAVYIKVGDQWKLATS